MKKIIIILLIFPFLASCDDDKPAGPKGCLTGIKNGSRVTIRCCYYEDYKAGESATPSWNNYTDHEWKAVKHCEECL